jgi:hypothetical protein
MAVDEIACPGWATIQHQLASVENKKGVLGEIALSKGASLFYNC